MENQINAVIDEGTLTQVNESIGMINNALPFLVELTNEQVKRMNKMEDGRVEFVRKALTLAEADSRLAPQFFSMDDVNKDMALCTNLDLIIVKVKKLLRQLEDTRILAGSEALGAALEVYNTTKRGSKKGVDGMKAAYDELSPFFEKQGNTAAKKPVNTK